ncbi:ATP-binding protein [Pseudoflavonifractor sp. MSJ-37]|uniref:ATP-binding protein n=1 Tax=Pseudoflavonifractor sp. MSJ-37 TaxID=2841531 RepID=UPI001C11B125|nr:ATP-binding protein [Pseudoflavonifractor sp. MSJ-37]MBU5435649.1 response regulator [Pseudoflavonifractor sp. MSJ-37]
MMAEWKKRLDRLSFRAVAVLTALMLIGGILWISVRSDLTAAEEHLSGILSYVDSQCSIYDITELASETKSLMRVIQETRHVERAIHESGVLPGEEALQTYAEDTHLTGILLLDLNGVCQACYLPDRAEVLGVLDSEFHKETLLDAAVHPEKTYSTRLLCADGSYLDLAACGRTDGEGVIAAYYHTPLAYIEAYSLSIPKLLSGYQIDSDGVVVVASGSSIVASNDISLVGTNMEDDPTLRALMDEVWAGELVMLPGDTGFSRNFGMIERGRNYYVYAYLHGRDAFPSTPRNVLFALLLYAAVFLLIQFLSWRTAQQHHEDQLQQERMYQEKLLEAARRAERANMAKTEFLQRMSHDIRTPINGIRGMVEISEHYRDDMAKQDECREKIWNASSLLLDLVNEVLDMGKLESGNVVLESRPFHLVSLVDEIGDTLDRTAAQRGITIERQDWDLIHPDLIGSPLHVKRLLMNILSNAVKYNKDGGHISLSCRELPAEGDRVTVEFICADTGIGMSEEFQKHLFEPFTQEHSDARSTYNGTGLGMAIAKSLVDQMGGTIVFESKLGVGTTYRITIPFQIASEPAPRPAAGPPSGVSLDGLCILVAEDNALNLEIAQFLLENAGARLTTTVNGQEAVDCFAAAPVGGFDAVLMDVMMPIMDGYEATRAIRAMDRPDAKTVPIIAMTANAFADDRQKAIDAGMDEHLTKPLEPAKLLQVLAQYSGRTAKK